MKTVSLTLAACIVSLAACEAQAGEYYAFGPGGQRYGRLIRTRPRRPKYSGLPLGRSDARKATRSIRRGMPLLPCCRRLPRSPKRTSIGR